MQLTINFKFPTNSWDSVQKILDFFLNGQIFLDISKHVNPLKTGCRKFLQIQYFLLTYIEESKKAGFSYSLGYRFIAGDNDTKTNFGNKSVTKVKLILILNRCKNYLTSDVCRLFMSLWFKPYNWQHFQL